MGGVGKDSQEKLVGKAAHAPMKGCDVGGVFQVEDLELQSVLHVYKRSEEGPLVCQDAELEAGCVLTSRS